MPFLRIKKHSSFFIVIIFLIYPIFIIAEQREYTEWLDSKCGTFLPDVHNIAVRKGLTILNDDNRPILAMVQQSASGRFFIHYDTNGVNAVRKTDTDGNRIPDYIDSVSYWIDYVHDIQVNNLDYLSPALDSGLGGTIGFDIYVMNLGEGELYSPGLYGYTVPEIQLPGGNPFRPRYSVYMVIDNDYSERDSSIKTNGVKYRTYSDTSFLALKITLAHEYHHAIQFMYGEDNSSPSMNELTSTFMEWRLFPETKDYYQYVNHLFKKPESYPFGKGVPVTGYLYSIFGKYLYKTFGDGVLKSMWEIISTGVQSYDALDRSLSAFNNGLSETWCNFMPWLYFTGERANGTGFEDAESLPLVSFFRDEEFVSPAFTTSAGLLSFEFRFLRVRLDKQSLDKTQSTFDLILTNTDKRSAIYQSDYEMPYIFSLINKTELGYEKIGDSEYFFKVIQDKGNICANPYYSAGIITRANCYAYPNPFVIERDNKIYFPAPFDAIVGEKISFILYDSESRLVINNDLTVTVHSGNRVAEFNPANLNLHSGVYIFKTSKGGSNCLGKIAIIN